MAVFFQQLVILIISSIILAFNVAHICVWSCKSHFHMLKVFYMLNADVCRNLDKNLFLFFKTLAYFLFLQCC